MPCYMTGSALGDAELSHQETVKRMQAEIDELRKAEAILCGVFSKFEEVGSRQALVIFLSSLDWEKIGLTIPDAAQWWENHKAKDAERSDG